jgi:hypothetical protein
MHLVASDCWQADASRNVPTTVEQKEGHGPWNQRHRVLQKGILFLDDILKVKGYNLHVGSWLQKYSLAMRENIWWWCGLT